jgi:hypothetical protein
MQCRHDVSLDGQGSVPSKGKILFLSLLADLRVHPTSSPVSSPCAQEPVFSIHFNIIINKNIRCSNRHSNQAPPRRQIRRGTVGATCSVLLFLRHPQSCAFRLQFLEISQQIPASAFKFDKLLH